MQPKSLLPTLLLSSAICAAGCGRSGGGGPGEPAPTAPKADPTVDETLRALGVDTTDTPRIDHAGDALPASFSPLGTAYTLEKQSELLLLGVPRQGSAHPLTVLDAQIDPLDPDQPVQLLHSLAADEVPWATESVPTFTDLPPWSKRAAAAADLDGDGRQELALVHFSDGELRLSILEDADGEFGRVESVLAGDWSELVHVALAAGDLDGDGKDELLLGYSLSYQAVIALVREVDGSMQVDEGSARSFPTQYTDSVLLPRMRVGQLDYDGPAEIALVLNEHSLPGWSSPSEPLGSTWHVLDDLGHDLVQLAWGRVEAEDELGTLRRALVADVALGDLDSDGIDELALAGLWMLGEFCQGSYVMSAFDDAAHGFAHLGSAVLRDEAGNEPGGSGCEAEIQFAHVGIADLEGDHAGEIHVNELVFWDLRTAPPWTLRAQISTWFNESWPTGTTSTAMAVADFTGDARQDIAVLTIHQPARLTIWGIAQEDPDQEIAALRTIPLATTPTYEDRNPVLVPLDADRDATVLRFVERRWAMTQPIVVAALAAAPGKEGIGQNTGACVTEYGEASSSSTGSENKLEVSAAFIIGWEFKVAGNGGEFEAKLQADYTHTWTNNYTLTTSVAYETGPLEDTVICVVTPFDQYVYEVVSDEDPENEGSTVVLSLPREQITLQVERSFFNDTVAAEDRIGEEVFRHRIGDPSSYPTKAQKNALLGQWVGMETGPTSVGQGAGSTSLGIEVATETGSSDYLGGKIEIQAKVLVSGYKVGGSIGFGGGHTWKRSVGESTTYSGTVGSIDAANFQANRYSFGLFVYTYEDGRPTGGFDVLNYWIE